MDKRQAHRIHAAHIDEAQRILGRKAFVRYIRSGGRACSVERIGEPGVVIEVRTYESQDGFFGFLSPTPEAIGTTWSECVFKMRDRSAEAMNPERAS